MPKTPKNSQNGGKQAQKSQKCSKKMQKSQKIRKRSKTAQCHVDVGGASRQVGHMWWGTERVHLSFLRPPPEGSTLRTPASVRAFWRQLRDRSSFDPRWCFLALFGYLCFFCAVLYLFAVFWLFLVLFLWFCGPFMAVSFYFVAVCLIIVCVFVMLVSACGDVLLFYLLLFCVCCYCFVSLWSFLCFWSLCIFFGQILRL